MSHPYLDNPTTGVHDYPDDYDEEQDMCKPKLYTCISRKGTRVWSPNLELLKQVCQALWPPSHKNKRPRFSITVQGVDRG